MTKGLKKEGSVVSNIKGFQGTFGGTPPVKRKHYKKNPSRPYGDDELFENAVAKPVMENIPLQDVVRQRGNSWIYYDDETGAQKGSFKDRESAWEIQRRDRKVKAGAKPSRRTERERQRKSLVPTKAKKASVEKGKSFVKRQSKAGQRHEKARSRKTEVKNLFIKHIKENRTMISYMFEQVPASDESRIWDHFMNKLSREMIMSDKKLKMLIQNIMKTEAGLLGKAVDTIAKILGGVGFTTQKKGASKDPMTGEVAVDFVVIAKESNKKFRFSVRLESSKPLLVIPEETRDVMNSMPTPESKLLRAELMHAQETELNQMDDVQKVSAKRDKYLSDMQKKLEKILNGLGPLEVALLKHTLKTKYRGK